MSVGARFEAALRSIYGLQMALQFLDHGVVGSLLGQGLGGIGHVSGLIGRGSIGLTRADPRFEPSSGLATVHFEQPSRLLLIHALSGPPSRRWDDSSYRLTLSARCGSFQPGRTK